MSTLQGSASARFSGIVTKKHVFDVPLDYAQPEGQTISVTVREIVAREKERDDLPCLLFFKGGPGMEADRPYGKDEWMKCALDEYRVLLLDQRGNGLSTPVTHQTLSGMSADAQFDYLRHFRADNIVRDAEEIRKRLLGPNKKWSILGHSFGGFCALRYLSAAPERLDRAFIAAGLPALSGGPDPVYHATYETTVQKNKAYFKRYPDDAEILGLLADRLQEDPVALPGGGTLTPRRFQQVGLDLGYKGGFENIHYMLERAFTSQGDLSYRFLRDVEAMQIFEINPIYYLLHESIYCQGQAANWSAHRVRDAFPAFDDTPLLFTGEMIYPWMGEDYAHLAPLQAAAEKIAAYDGWPDLYDPHRLAANEVPTAVLIVFDDMFVPHDFSIATAQHIPNLSYWVTNEYDHVGFYDDGERAMGRLIDMMHGDI